MKNLRLSDVIYLFLLILLALFVWLRDLTWMTSSDDTLPIIIALPLFVWLGWPWELKAESSDYGVGWIALGIMLFLAGILTNLTILLAIAWTVLLWAWISARIETAQKKVVNKLLVLPLLAFPWITYDADRIGWWFRLSGAAVTAGIFNAAGQEVTHEGTNLVVNGLPISVEAACSGLNTLQSMLIAGTVANFVLLNNSWLYWLNIPLLVLMSWVANTLRIIAISLTALLVSPEFALGPFHTIGGWALLMLMFGLCWVILSAEADYVAGKKIN